jgi:hypothetical protein
VLNPVHGIICGKAHRELHRIVVARAALAKRLARLTSGRLTHKQRRELRLYRRHHGKNADLHFPTRTKRVALLERLEAKAQRLEQRFETRCHVSAPVS